MPLTSTESGKTHLVGEDVYCYTNQIVNLFFVGNRDQKNGWVLVDAGMPRSADKIIEQAEELYGEGAVPSAIILTHGHFDHVGALPDLAEKWKVSVYAHPLEIPYLTGETSYDKPDPTVDGGTVAKLSKMFPNEPVDLGGYVKELPQEGSIPEMPGWKWYHTPGHTPGHVSLFRESDRTLIAGDAFTTVKQDEMFEVVKQEKEINGPPVYYTPNWEDAEESVKKLAELKPLHAATGHGKPMTGEELEKGLAELARTFKEKAVPDHGKYVDGDK
ncbi:MBL fold metallo-hydrolase [Virgibacillus sediminis]|uniref:MBL fold metallo-hydrolase n=1 Tax=Virgibacillus sediminis TaxID=202260 RepID=A0ABV7A851_9BACI